MELDALDKKILFHLDHDGRESLKRMAKALRTSAEHIRYRIQRLEKNGIIKRYMAFVNFSELGFVGHGVFCSLRGKDSRAKLVETLEKNDRVYWISDFGGKYDLAFAIAAKDTYEFYKIFNGLKEALSTHASAWEVAIRIRLTQYPRSYLVADEKKRTKEMPFFGVALGHQKIDKLHLRL